MSELIDAKPKSIYRAFSFFFLHENSQRGYIRVRKLGYLKTDTHSQRWERRLQENGLAWGVESCVTSLRKSSPFLALWPVFHAPRRFFGTQSVLVHFLPNMCLRKSRYLKFRCARPQCVVLHTLVLMYSCSYVLKFHMLGSSDLFSYAWHLRTVADCCRFSDLLWTFCKHFIFIQKPLRNLIYENKMHTKQP